MSDYNSKQKYIPSVFEIFLGIILFALFLWLRVDVSGRIYFFGDANGIVELIKIMLQSGDWEADFLRVEGVQKVDPLRELFDPKKPASQEFFYNFAGYVAIGAAITQIVYFFGFDYLPVQTILHMANVVFQFATLLLICLVCIKLFDRLTAWLAAGFYVFFPLVVIEAHYVRPEAWLCFLATAVLYCALYTKKYPLIAYSLMGMFLGLSFAAKFNQLFLGMVPAILLIYELCNKDFLVAKRVNSVLLYGMVIVVSMVLAIWLNTPYLIKNFYQYLISMYEVYGLYKDPIHPHFIENYSYLNQLWRNTTYFLHTIGVIWCLLFVVGVFKILYQSVRMDNQDLKLCIVLPCLFLLFYFASLQAVFERNFSSVEGFVAIITAVGLKSVLSYKESLLARYPVLIVLAFSLVVYQPAKLNFVFVNNYIHGNGNAKRLDFQQEMKKDFPGFWFKNVHDAYSFINRIPEKAPKAPRIYIIRDYNGPWASRLVDSMRRNGFVSVGEYRSEFYKMPTNNLTVYHQQHRYHYLVLKDEIPENVGSNYFKKNF